MKNLSVIFKILFLAFVLSFAMLSCVINKDDSNDGEWIDPATQTAQLTNGIVLTRSGGGNNALPKKSPYSFEMYANDYSKVKMTWYGPDQGGGGAFKAEWSAYFLARLGYYWGNGGPYTNYKNIYADYNFKRSGTSPGGFIGVYGWSRNPSASKDVEKLIEYYIVDDWFYSTQLDGSQIGQGASNVVERGSFSVDGAAYKMYTAQRTNEPSIDGTKTFTQIFSVRQGKRTCGTISVTEHFKAWSKFITLGNMYEAKFKVETFGGTGSLDLTYLYLAQEDKQRIANE